MKSFKMTAALLALTAGFGVCAPVLAEPPPYFGWYGSTWTTRYEIVPYLNGGSGIRYPVEIAKKTILCNGGGTDESGRSNKFCGLSLKNPSDLKYTYEIREFSDDNTLVRFTGCSVIGNCWICSGETSISGDPQSFEMKTPHKCGD